MGATTPEDLQRQWAAAFAAGNSAAATALYESDAVLIAQPGVVVQGHTAIQAALDALLATQPRFDFRFGRAIETGDVALLLSQWTLAGSAPDGTPFEVTGQTADVARRQPNGTWLVAIDNPYGGQSV